jgi:ankyrin repeat protein
MSEGEQIRQTVRILLEAGADPNMKNDADETPLYLATYYGEIEAAEELLAFGGDINDVFIGLLDNKIVALATKYESQLTENNRKTWKKKPRGTISIKTGINE